MPQPPTKLGPEPSLRRVRRDRLRIIGALEVLVLGGVAATVRIDELRQLIPQSRSGRELVRPPGLRRCSIHLHVAILADPQAAVGVKAPVQRPTPPRQERVMRAAPRVRSAVPVDRGDRGITKPSHCGCQSVVGVGEAVTVRHQHGSDLRPCRPSQRVGDTANCQRRSNFDPLSPVEF